MVVVDGADRLREGAKVELVTRDAPARRRPRRARRGKRGAKDGGARPGTVAPRATQGRRAAKRCRTRRPHMNPSRPFILRPVATSLLMVAILLVGIVAYRVLPLSALPEVDYPTIQVVTLYPGASPDVMTSSITAPLERQFGQMPGLNQMSSTSSGGASVITLQFSLDLTLDVAEQEVQAAINAARHVPADRPAGAADLQQGQSGRRADPHAGAHLAHAAAARSRRTSPTRGSRRRSRSSPASAWSASAAASGRRCASRPIRRRSPPTASALDDVRTAIANANVNQAKGSFDGPTRASTIDANDQLQSADEYRS